MHSVILFEDTNVAIELPEKLFHSDLENIVDIWYRKSGRMIV